MAEQRTSGRTPAIAVSLAVIALVTVVIAVVVVASRKAPAMELARIEDRGPLAHRVAASDVVKLDRDSLEATTAASGIPGVKVTDVELRTLLALAPTDVITAISGRPIKRQFDVYDAVVGASNMNATALYVELVREGKPVLVRWELDGDLRTARAGTRKPRSGGLFPPSPAPSSVPYPDPLVDTVRKIDDHTYELPRSTVDAVFGTPGTVARGARIVPSMKMGQPNGFKIYAVRPGSLYAALGIMNGDTVQTINGYVLDDPSAALDLYGKLKGVDSIRIELERRGRPEVLKITITP